MGQVVLMAPKHPSKNALCDSDLHLAKGAIQVSHDHILAPFLHGGEGICPLKVFASSAQHYIKSYPNLARYLIIFHC